MFMDNDLTAEQRLQKAVIDIMDRDKYTALAGILMIGKKQVLDGLPSAATNGRDEYYGREFVDDLNDAQFRFVILHENFHKLYRHLTTWKHLFDENPILANMACDYVINLQIVDDNPDGFAVMPTDKKDSSKVVGLVDEKYRGWNSQQVYNDLRKQHPKLAEMGDAIGKAMREGQHGGGVSQEVREALEKAGIKTFDDHDWEGAQEMSESEKRDLARDIDEAIRQGAMMAGKSGTGGERTFEDLLQPQIDWREVLREFITQTCAGHDYSTWRRPNRRYLAAGIYLPSGASEQVDELVLAIDTSGSVSQGELVLFLSEVKCICDTVHPRRVRLLYWDTTVCRDEVYDLDKLDDLTRSTKPEGGGGTAVECVPQYMAENNIKPQAAIVLTDGYLGGSWGTWSVPVLWCIVDNKSAHPSVGKYVHIEDMSR